MASAAWFAIYFVVVHPGIKSRERHYGKLLLGLALEIGQRDEIIRTLRRYHPNGYADVDMPQGKYDTDPGSHLRSSVSSVDQPGGPS